MVYPNIWDSLNYYIGKIPDLLFAFIVLLIGWLIAKSIEKAVLKGLNKTKLDDLVYPEGTERKYSSAKIISKVIYYLLLVFVFILFFNILNLSTITSPLVGMLASVMDAIPSILKAALVLLFAWIIASTLSFLIKKGGKKLRVHETLSKWKLTETVKDPNAAVEQVANIVFYLVLLIFLPAVLDALNLQGIAGPFSSMLDSLLAFLPKLIAAALILLVGWFIAKIVRNIVTNFLAAIGTEKLTAKLGLSRLFEGTSLSAVIGTIVYVLILIPTVISALEQLDITGISAPAIAMLTHVMTILPNIAAAIFFVLIGIWLGKWVKDLIASVLMRMGLDSYFNRIFVNKSAVSISQIFGTVANILIVVLFTVQALNILNLNFLVALATGVVAYLPHVLAALVIIGVGLWLAALVKKLLLSLLQGPHASFLAIIAQVAIISTSIFMALDQLGIASSIVNAAFILLLGGLALAFGLAFGLGGKDFASKYLQKLDRKFEETNINKQANTKDVVDEAIGKTNQGSDRKDLDNPLK
ncbi:mechanosensitive ion channel [Bacillus sp. CRN 9]|nr:mechanosensitive ion channel [Bacillus sp. CRN 9]